MKTNLTKSITIHSAYGVEVEYENGQIYTVAPTHCGSDHEKKTLGVNCAINDVYDIFMDWNNSIYLRDQSPELINFLINLNK